MEQSHKLAVAIGEDVVRLAPVGADGRLGAVQSWPRANFLTLTDALLAFERGTGATLRGAACAVAILGTTHGDVIRLTHGSWTISQAGFRSIFARDALVVNDVAARAWAVLGGVAGRPTPVGGAAGQPDFSRPGRWALTHVDRGVGLSVIDVDQTGRQHVLECEMGHCGFCPAGGEELALHAALAVRGGAPTWEQALTLGWDDPAWRAPGLPATRSGRVAMIARLMGRYAGEIVLAHGAWSGVLVTGSRMGEIALEGALPAFNEAFEAKPRFARLVRAAPRWQLTGKDVTMPGLAVALRLHPAVRGRAEPAFA